MTYLVLALLVCGVAVGLLGPRVFVDCAGSADTTEGEMLSLAKAVDEYVLEHGAVPATLEDLMQASEKSREPYIDKIPLDPWGRSYQYRVVDAARRYFQMRSSGEDGRFDTDDDLTWPKWDAR